MVGGFVKQQKIGLAQEQAAERDASAFTTGEGGDIAIRGRQAECVHCDFDRAFEIPRTCCFDLGFEFSLLLADLLEVGIGVAPLRQNSVIALKQRGGFAQAIHDVAHDVFGLVEVWLLLK